MTKKKYDIYSKTMIRVREVEELILNGLTVGRCRQTLSDLWSWPDLSERHARRYYKIAQKRIKSRFEKDFESDYQWCRDNYMRLFSEAIDDQDRSEQRQIINDFRKLSGLDEHVVTHKFDISDEDIDRFDQLFS